MIDKILSKVNKKQIGKFIANFFDLYTQAPKVWRAALSSRKQAFDLITSYLVFYFLLMMILVKDTLLTIKLSLLDLSTIFLPFVILIVPFLFFVKLYNKRIKIKNLFRLSFIIKIQLLPILYIIMFLERISENEDWFIIANNLIWISWVGFVVILPAVISITFKRKIVWIASNYLWLNFCFFLISFFNLKPPDLVKGYEAITKSTINDYYQSYSPYQPDDEYAQFRIRYSKLIFYDKLCLAKIKTYGFGKFKIEPQFLSENLLNIILKQAEGDSLLIKDPFSSASKNIINLRLLDSMKNVFNRDFYEYRNTVQQLRKKATFKSNQYYFNVLYCYLHYYEKNHIDFDVIDAIANGKNNKLLFTTLLPDSTVVSLVKLDSIFYPKYRTELLAIEEEFSRRHNYSMCIMKLVLFPSRFVNSLLNKDFSL